MIRLLHNHALILPDKTDAQTKGGVYLPEGAKRREIPSGTIYVPGEGLWKDGHFEGSPFKEGDKVIYRHGSGAPFVYEDVEYEVVNFDNIIAIL